MRRVAGITIASFGALSLAGVVGSAPFEVGLEPSPETGIIIDKELPEGYDGEVPTEWVFRIDSVNCGDSIFPPGHGGTVETLIVSVPGAGGESERIGVFADFGPGGFVPCDYRIIELEVDGWEPVTPAGGVAEVTPAPGETLRVPFTNRPAPPTTTTTVAETTTTVAETTTTVAETTTTAADTTTTAAPTTAPPTTGTVAPELPETGSSSALTGLLAALLVLGGLGAVVASRRT